MMLNPDVKNIFDFKFEDFTLVDYDPHPHIKGQVAQQQYFKVFSLSLIL